MLYKNKKLKDIEREWPYLATDKDGKLWGYDSVPKIGESCFYLVDVKPEQNRLHHVGNVEYNGNWKDSIRES